METVEPGARSWPSPCPPAPPAPRPPHSDSCVPGWGQGHSGRLDPASVYPSVAEKVFPLGDLQVAGKSDYGVARPHPSPRAQQGPPCPVPAWWKLGSEIGSKQWGKDAGPVRSTGRPRAPRFSLPGLRPPDGTRETPRKCPGHPGASAASFLSGDGEGRAGAEVGVGVRTRPSGPDPQTPPLTPKQGVKVSSAPGTPGQPLGLRASGWETPEPGAQLQEAGLSWDRAQPPCPGLAMSTRVEGGLLRERGAPQCSWPGRKLSQVGVD